MRKLIAYEFLSIDGYMAGRKGQEMDFVTQNFVNEKETDIALEYETTKLETSLEGKAADPFDFKSQGYSFYVFFGC